MDQPPTPKELMLGCLAVMLASGIFWLLVIGAIRALYELAIIISAA
ncbi:hypothetical protein [Nonomuraea lactucae]|nr:hypothetical protein [Nonomuraea lactucae]